MLTDVRWLNVDPYLAQGIQPAVCVERPLRGDNPKQERDGIFQVAASPLLMVPVDWSLVTTGEIVRIPIHAYVTNSAALSSILATGLHLGAMAVESLQKIDNRSIMQLVMILGETCHHLEDRNCFRCYVGMAFRMQPK